MEHVPTSPGLLYGALTGYNTEMAQLGDVGAWEDVELTSRTIMKGFTALRFMCVYAQKVMPARGQNAGIQGRNQPAQTMRNVELQILDWHSGQARGRGGLRTWTNLKRCGCSRSISRTRCSRIWASRSRNVPWPHPSPPGRSLAFNFGPLSLQQNCLPPIWASSLKCLDPDTAEMCVGSAHLLVKRATASFILSGSKLGCKREGVVWIFRGEGGLGTLWFTSPERPPCPHSLPPTTSLFPETPKNKPPIPQHLQHWWACSWNIA